MPPSEKKASEHEYERLNPGASPDPAPKQPGATKPEKNDAALPGSQNSDLKGAKRDRTPRGMST